VCCILYDPGAALRHLSIMEVLAAIIGKIVNVDIASPVNERQQSVKRASTERQQSVKERQQSVNNFGCCILCHPRAVVRLLSIIEVLAAFKGNMVIVDVPSPDNERQQCVNRASTEHQQSINRVSTEHQKSWVLHLV